MKTLQTLVIGGGQAGLAAAWHLARQHLDFLVLEAAELAGGAWRWYYDSLALFSPARYSALPGMPFPGDPDRYPRRDEVVSYLADYARRHRFPIHTGERVVAATRCVDHFEVTTAGGQRYRARSMIAASGTFGAPHMPVIPGWERFGGRIQHSSGYRNPASFAGHRVVVVGAANSAVQIAAELSTVAEVTLASLRPIRFFPQRVLGRDFHFWLEWTRLGRTRWLSDRGTPVLDDGRYRAVIASGRVSRRAMFKRITDRGVVWSDTSEESVDDLLFATGFRPDIGYLQGLDAVDATGRLVPRNGIAMGVPGLYFVGFPGQRNFASATLRGVGADAASIMPRLLRHLREGRAA
jgi:putative flavoprotein involved in K+ transport